jgi:EAL domain-containing protein (putative c-di-GMP-specific phosphodiesterase class I)
MRHMTKHAPVNQPTDVYAMNGSECPPQVGLQRVLELGLRHLGVDAAYIAETNATGQMCRAAAGDAESFGIAVGEALPEGAPNGRELASGVLPSCVGEVEAGARLAGLARSTGARVGSFIGVPLRHSDGTLFGSLCGLGHLPCPSLDERETRFLSMLAELITGDLDEQRRAERLEADLARLIETEDVRVAYQPIVDVRSGRCLGLEALARFPEPYVRPDLTLDAAESVGLRIELERLVISQAWPTIALLGEDQFLAMNLAPDALVELARRANLRPDISVDRIVIEVTEHAVVDSYAMLHEELEPLRRRGLRIAVDDAGAGYSSLRHVLELRPDFIKIDRWLIDGIAKDHARRVAVGAFMSLARDLGSVVVAEGVERDADLAAVRRLGLHAVQGYLLGRPTTDPGRVANLLEAMPAIGEGGVERRPSRAPHRRDPVLPAGF